MVAQEANTRIEDWLEKKRRELMAKMANSCKELRMSGQEGLKVSEDGRYTVCSLEAEIVAEAGRVASRELERVEEALRKVKEGTYGICADCGGEITLPRLKAVPYATLCVRCQNKLESEESHPRKPSSFVEDIEE